MSTFHAVVWMDHAEAHVLMFDSEHVQGERVHSRSKHSHQGKHPDNKAFYGEIVQALEGSHEVLLTGAGTARTEFKTCATATPRPVPTPSFKTFPATTRATLS